MSAWKFKNMAKKMLPSAGGTTHSIRTRILIPIFLVIAAQFALLVAGIWGSGLVRQLDTVTLETLQQTVGARTDYLQYDMVNRWCNVGTTVSEMNRIYDEMIRDGMDAKKITEDSASYTDFLTQAMPELISLMRKNAVTGAFVVLNTEGLPEDFNEELSLPGLYLRDRDPSSAYTAENNDIMLERAPIEVVSRSGISTDSGWMPMFNMCAARENENAFFKPYRAALSRPELTYGDLSYWSKPYRLEGDNYSCISYSVPLIGEDGTVYGVLGVEVLTDYIQRQLPATELADGMGAYVICVRDSHGGLSPIILSSQNYRYDLEAFSGLTMKPTDMEGVFQIHAHGVTQFFACTGAFNLYNSNVPYSGDQWVLLAAVPQFSLTALSSQMTFSLQRILMVVLSATLLVLTLISLGLSRPIARLEQEVRLGTGKATPVKLTRSGITELDSLAQGVETLNAEVLRNEAKLSSILEMSSTNLGAFEYDTNTHSLFATEGFLRVFGGKNPDFRLTGDNFEEYMRQMDAKVLVETLRRKKGRNECVYNLECDGKPLWVRLKTIQRNNVIVGLAEDYTREWQEMRKLEFERDHDALTGILNRRAFHERLHFLLTGGVGVQHAALLMADLDNLKYINDTYGHDYGDSYIRLAAQILSSSCPEALTARMSGDEFFLLLYGYDSDEEIRAVLDKLKEQIHARKLQFPDGTETIVRASAGIAWYPKDATDPDQLIRFADFAMYKGKHSTKGTFVDFDRAVYQQEAYLLQGKENLNRLVEQKKVKYFFQPILSVADGKVVAYEALMRPQIDSFKSPMDVLTLARQESKLAEVEQLTWFAAMEAFVHFCEAGKIPEDRLVFINSISNQILSEEASTDFAEKYRKYLPRIVQEHTEEEQSDTALLHRKLARLHEWEAKLALDDYGSGYNGENVLVATEPDYVKADMEIVRNVDKDINKQQLISGLVAYARPRGIHVIAEGVETEAEMRMAVHLGVEFIQGYYVAYPAEEPPAADAAHVKCILDAVSRNAEEQMA